MRTLYCACCGRPFHRTSMRGPAPLYCSADCRAQMQVRRRVWTAVNGRTVNGPAANHSAANHSAANHSAANHSAANHSAERRSRNRILLAPA